MTAAEREALAAGRDRVERAAGELHNLLKEAYRLMPLGTKVRGEWLSRAGELLVRVHGGGPLSEPPEIGGAITEANVEL